MLDTGSTRSFISPKLANKFFSDFKQNETFEVISTHATSKHGEVVYIQLPKIFKSNLRHKFYIYSVDDRYDGLIGSDLLKLLDASIDMKSLSLITNNTVIPIIYSNTLSPMKETYILPPRCELKVNLPVDLKQGEAILDFQQFSEGIRMPAALVNCVNGFASTVIQNSTEEEQTLTIIAPFKVEPYIENKKFINLNFTNDPNNTESLLENNLKKIKLDHMNEEEKNIIEKLCREYHYIV